MEPLNWGVLGAAKFAKEHMAPAIHMAKGARLYGLATSASEKSLEFINLQPDIKVMDYGAILADPAVDAVYIPLPNHLHVDYALRALDAGKHVLVEKPLAMSADAFDSVIAKRDATGLLAAEAFMIVHHPQWHRAKALLAEGAIGDLLHVEATFSYDNSTAPNNIRNRSETGGGGLPDIGVYTFGSVRFATGQEPTQIDHADVRFENGVDTFARVAASFPGFTYSAVVSMRMAPRQDVVFHGSTGVMRLTAPFNPGGYGDAQLRVERGGRSAEIERWPGVNHYVLQVENFCRSVREGVAYPCPLEFSKGTQRMIDMVFEAAK